MKFIHTHRETHAIHVLSPWRPQTKVAIIHCAMEGDVEPMTGD